MFRRNKLRSVPPFGSRRTGRNSAEHTHEPRLPHVSRCFAALRRPSCAGRRLLLPPAQQQHDTASIEAGALRMPVADRSMGSACRATLTRTAAESASDFGRFGRTPTEPNTPPRSAPAAEERIVELSAFPAIRPQLPRVEAQSPAAILAERGACRRALVRANPAGRLIC